MLIEQMNRSLYVMLLLTYPLPYQPMMAAAMRESLYKGKVWCLMVALSSSVGSSVNAVLLTCSE
jgi:hypothetical protein